MGPTSHGSLDLWIYWSTLCDKTKNPPFIQPVSLIGFSLKSLIRPSSCISTAPNLARGLTADNVAIFFLFS